MTALTDPGVGTALVLGGAALLWGLWKLRELSEERRYGRLVALDEGTRSTRLSSERYRLVGEPDELRRRPDGRVVPVEWKSRSLPERRIPDSHRVQVEAYCLLVEEALGVVPPFGILRYSDGREIVIPWDAAAREEVLAVRRALDRTYEGEADPTRSKCARCRYRSICDARADRYGVRAAA
ncbi:MAG: PD-(D/E)XK nuclease family protein [Thermoplasmata archaeon]|nr:PD-(D/E)XK nuclease family protein [Thermoplasmata archaeon]